MKKIALLLMALFLVSSVSAVDIQIELERFQEVYNANADEVPGIIKTLFGNERIDITVSEISKDDAMETIDELNNAHAAQQLGETVDVTQDDIDELPETMVIGVALEDGLIKEIKEGSLDNPTMKAYLTEETAVSILVDDDPFTALLDAIDSGAVTYEATTFTGTIKYGIAGFVGTVVGFFI
jgi:hypothetical protein